MYLRLPQQVDGESQPVRTAGLQLQGDEGQGQHGSSELQNKISPENQSLREGIGCVPLKENEYDATWSLLPNCRGEGIHWTV